MKKAGNSKEDLFEKSLELHKGLYIFNPDFWKNIYNLRKRLNYQSAIIKELPVSANLSEEEEIELIKQVLKDAREKERIVPNGEPGMEQVKKQLKDNIRRKRWAWREE